MTFESTNRTDHLHKVVNYVFSSLPPSHLSCSYRCSREKLDKKAGWGSLAVFPNATESGYYSTAMRYSFEPVFCLLTHVMIEVPNPKCDEAANKMFSLCMFKVRNGAVLVSGSFLSFIKRN